MKLFAIFFVFVLTACASQKAANHPITVPDTSIEIENVPTPSDKTIADSTTDNNQLQPDKFNVMITLSHHSPYCSGAYPSQEILQSLYRVQANTNFVLVNKTTLEKKWVTTNAEGVLYLDLPEGTYGLKEGFKECTFEEFKQQNPAPSGIYYVTDNGIDPNSDCYKNWWQSYLGEFEINSTSPDLQNFNWGTSSACFTGNNPCVIYNGPIPP